MDESFDEYLARIKVGDLEEQKITLEQTICQARAVYRMIYNGRKSRFLRLPYEILALILEHACLSKCGSMPETTVSAISNHLRDVALRVSSLWTKIDISVAKPTMAYLAYLERSQYRPLFITLNFCGSSEPQQHQDTWVHIRPAMSRCHRLHIKADQNPLHTIYPILRHLQKCPMVLLEKLSIDLEDYDDPQDIVAPQPIFLPSFAAPRLRSLDLCQFGLQTHLPPVSGLTTLYLHRVLPETRWTCTAFQQFISYLPRLSRLSVHGCPLSNPGEFNASHKLIFPSLHILRLCYDDDEADSFPPLWFHAEAPVLETLHLVKSYPVDVEELAEAIGSTPIFPSIQHFVNDDATYNIDGYHLLGAIFPSVKYFTCINDLNPAIESLRKFDDLWPKLQSLRLWGDVNADVNNFKIRDMLQERIERKQSIPTLCISNKPPMFPNWLLREYVALELICRPPYWPEWVTL